MLQDQNQRIAPVRDSSPTRKGVQNNTQQNNTSGFNQAGGDNNVNESGNGSKKRSREEMLLGNAVNSANVDADMMNLKMGSLGINSQGNDGGAIEKLIVALREKVLNGETLNNFKKEIAQISIMIDKCENQQMFEKSVYWLANILQKPEREISLMLKRNCL